MYQFSPETEKYLHLAGWSKEHCIDTGEYKSMLDRENLPLFPNIMQFMAQYGDLIVSFPDRHHAGHTDSFHINPETQMKQEWVSYCVQKIGKPLCPIGTCHAGQVDMLMDAEGRVYGNRDDYVWGIGDSGEDAIEALCTGRLPSSEHAFRTIGD